MKTDKIDLIARHCQANHKMPDCIYYERNAKDCRLLKTNQLTVFFEQERCQPQNMIAAAVRGNLRGWQDRFEPEEFQQYVENGLLTKSLALEARQEILKSLQGKSLKDSKLSYFKAYINRTTYHIVIHWLQDEGRLSSGKCVACIHLSKIENDAICQRKTILEYLKDETGKFVDLEISNPEHGKKKTPSRDSCKKGFEPYQFESVEEMSQKGMRFHHAETPTEFPNLLAFECERYLKHQINVTQGKERQKWISYHAEFVRFTQLFGRFMLTETSLSVLEQQGVSREIIERLAIVRDYEFSNHEMFITAIRQLLGKNVTQNSQNPLRNQIVNAARLTRQQVFEQIARTRGISAETMKDHWNEIMKILHKAGILSDEASETAQDSSRYEEGGEIL